MAGFSVFLFAIALGISSTYAQSCGSGSVQLVGGTMGREGRLEVCYNGQWGTVCDDYFYNVEARVACRHVGYPSDGAVALRNGYFGAGSGNIWLDNLHCTGSEGSIFSCPRSNAVGVHNCDHSEDAGVRCPPCVEGNVVFIRGNSKQGVPMLCHDGSYGTICDEGFDVNDAKVICRMLGYPTEEVQAFSGSTRFNIGYGDIFATGLGCTGDEERLTDCPGQFYTANTCTHAQDAGVICPSCDDWLGVQLWSAFEETPKSEGMVQICESNGQWRGMCSRGSWCADAKVACRDLGYSGSNHITFYGDVDQIYGYIRTINPFQYNCVGTEDHLSDCPRTYDPLCNQPQWQTIGIRCQDVPGEYNCTAGDVRFRKGTELSTTDEGRVEYCFENHWSPFCWLSDEVATIICKSKGYNEYNYAAIYDDERYGSVGLVSDFKYFACSGTASEDNLNQCEPKLSNSCEAQSCPAEYGMQCFNPGMCDEGTYRLVDGDIEQEGRIEVCLNGVWGVICDYGWSDIDAYVFCKQQGYDGTIAPVAYTTSQFGDGIYPAVWASFYCQGWETDLKECQYNTYLNFWCSRSRIAGVLCAEDCIDGDVRLVYGQDDSHGTVEVCYAGLWGLIDAASWDDNDAKVICKQLGLREEGSLAVLDSQYGRPNKTVHLSNVNCEGNELNIDECTKSVIALVDGKTVYKNNAVAGVDCMPEPPTPPACTVIDVPKVDGTECTQEGEMRLIGGVKNEIKEDGMLQYCYNGFWTVFCTLNDVVASVACKQLGYLANSKASIVTSGEFGSLKEYSIIENITCPTTLETSWSQCTILPAGDCIPSCPDLNIGIRCFADGQCNYGDIRLVNGFIEQEGRVEICVNDVWGVICDDGWDKTDAHIACQQLGYAEQEPIIFTGSYFGDGDFPIVYSNMQCIGPENDLQSCVRSDYLSFTCNRNQVAGVLCGYDCENGDVRLVGGSKSTEGTVEVCFENLWGLVSDGAWDEKDASVICKILGHSEDYAQAYLGSKYGKPNKTLLLSEVQCGGDEVQLDQCAYNFHSLVEGKSLIQEVQVAGVACLPYGCLPSSVSGTECTNGDLRVQGGATTEEGNLQYCLNGTWSFFCGLELDEASVACSQLGHPNNNYASVFDDDRFSAGSNMSYFQNFDNCSSDASNFADCVLTDLCTTICTNVSAIRCYNPSGCVEGSTRLMRGYLEQEGRLEICVKGVWSSICDTGFDQSDGLAACASLGYDVAEPVVYRGSMFGDGEGPIVYSNMRCEGFENDLTSCVKDEYPLSVCSRSNVVGVLCRDGCEEGDIKVVNGLDNEGTVLMCLDGLWTMISDSGWDTQEAHVACRTLGYPTEGAVIRQNSYYGKVNKTMGYYNFACIGTENNLKDCPKLSYTYDQGKLYALNMTVAGVYCQPPEPTEAPTTCPIVPTLPPTPACTNGDTQLAGGSTSAEGRLMYCYGNQWSPFCSVDGNTASVVCKSLGYSSSSASVFTDGRYGNSALNYSLFVDLSCVGSENELSDCPRVSTGCVPVCNDNVGIRCYTPTTCDHGSIRLVDGTIQQQGRIELCIHGIWSTVCAEGWDATNAFVVCQQLGFATKESTAYADNLFGSGNGPIVYSDVQCVGHEQNIAQCPKNTYPEISCPSAVAAGVLCADDCNDGDIMLYGGNTSYSGTVEVCFDNLYGLVSHKGWTREDAAVVCAQLGLETNDPTPIYNSLFGKPDKTVHLSNVVCYGPEASIRDCNAYKNSLNDGDGFLVAGVICPPIPYTSPVISLPPTNLGQTMEDTGVSESTLFLMAGIFGVIAVLAILSVVGLFVGMLIVYQKRKQGTDMSSTEGRINKRDSVATGGAMPLYAVVNKNRDSMVSFSANDGAVNLD